LTKKTFEPAAPNRERVTTSTKAEPAAKLAMKCDAMGSRLKKKSSQITMQSRDGARLVGDASDMLRTSLAMRD